MLSAHEFWPYIEKLKKGVPHLHPRWHADSGQGCRLISLVSAIMVSAAALGCAASRSHFWRCGHLGHYCATTANSTGSRQLSAARASSSPPHPQPPLPLLSTTSRPFLTWACPAWDSPADENVSASAASFMSTGFDFLALSFKVLSWKSTRNAFQTKLEVEYMEGRGNKGQWEKKGWRWSQYLHCMRFKWQQSRGLWWHLVRLWLSVQWTYDQGPLPTVSSNTMWAAPPSVTQCYMPAQPDQFAIQYSIWQMYLLLPINSYFSSFPFWLEDWMKPTNLNISLSKPDRFQGQSVLITDIVAIKAIT